MYIIDGHNLLWKLQGGGGKSAPAGDVEMCRIIGRYLKDVGDRGEIVFDGTGPPDKSGFYDIECVEVFFAGAGTDADTVIEDKITASSAPRQLSIISSDRRIRAAARSRRCSSIKSEVFWEAVERQLARKPVKREPTEKHVGLTEVETDQWLEMFGLDQGAE